MTTAAPPSPADCIEFTHSAHRLPAFVFFFLLCFMKRWHLWEMKPSTRHILLLWMLVCSGTTQAIEPISTTIAVGMAAALTGILARYQNIFYYFHECCRPEWISFNKTGSIPTKHPWTYSELHTNNTPTVANCRFNVSWAGDVLHDKLAIRLVYWYKHV